jgi:hypothetical protein
VSLDTELVGGVATVKEAAIVSTARALFTGHVLVPQRAVSS